MPPLTALVRSTPGRGTTDPAATLSGGGDDSRWLIQFAIVAAVAGLIAIVFIAVFLRS